jgi:hypothetical protein
MIVTLYNSFSKRENSTLLPAAGAGLQFQNVILKEPADLLAPVIRFSASGQLTATGAAPVVYTYAYIPKFTRYYFIQDWTYTGGCWEASLQVDVLASWKSIIGASSLYIERAESAGDGTIIDRAFPATTNFDVVHANIADSWYGVAPSGGCYVLGIINSDTAYHVGACAYYAFTQSQLSSLMYWLYGDNIFRQSNIDEFGEGLFKSVFNPIQYLVSAMWFPFSVDTFGSESAAIQWGYWSTEQSAVRVRNLSHQTFVTGKFPDHPQAASRGEFLNYSPYAYYTLYVPPFGAMPIDSSFRAYGDYIRCQVFVDHITGQATMRAGISQTAEEGTVSIWANEVSGMLGVPIQLSQVNTDYSGVAGNLLSGAAGAAAGGAAGALAVASSLVSSAADIFSPTVSSIGANGSFISTVAPPGLMASFARISGASDSIIGRPLLQQRTISSLSGFIKCRDPHISAPCLAAERGLIESALNGGFYYE